MIELRIRSSALVDRLARKAERLAGAAIARRRPEARPETRYDPAALWPLWRR